MEARLAPGDYQNDYRTIGSPTAYAPCHTAADGVHASYPGGLALGAVQQRSTATQATVGEVAIVHRVQTRRGQHWASLARKFTPKRSLVRTQYRPPIQA